MSLTLHTSVGDLKVALACEEVPRPCYNFLALAGAGFYDGLTFHRNMPGFMVQGGDPAAAASADGEGYVALPERGPPGGESIWGGKFADSFHKQLRHDARGVLSMANKGPDSNGSQFFLTYGAQPHLDDVYCVFGRLVDGADTLAAMEKAEPSAGKKKSRPAQPIVIRGVTIHANPFATGDIAAPVP